MSTSAQESPDLSAYRRRAADMLRTLEAGGKAGGDRLLTLGVIRIQLAALIEDLKSVGVPDAVLDLLQKLYKALEDLLNVHQPAEADVERVWQGCEATLRAFAGLPAGAPAPAKKRGRKEEFWK